MKDTAVVILNYNGRNYLEKFLPTVVACSGTARVIVADNNSSDDSVEWLKKSALNIEIIALAENLGYSGGYNEALRQVEADVFVLLNSDVEVTPGWLDPMLSLLEADPAIAAVQPKILSYQERERFEYAGGAGGFIDRFGYPFCRGRIFNSFENDSGQYDSNCDIFWASGACLVVRSRDFFDAGGLDTDFFAHMEEIDLCWRLHGHGKRIVACGNSTVYHVGGGTLNSQNPQKTYLNFRNGLSLLFKNVPGKVLWQRMLVRSLLDIVAFFRFIFLLQLNHGGAVLRAHAVFWSGLRYQRQKRIYAQTHMRVSSIPRIYKQGLVYQYYIRGVRKFSDLKGTFTTDQ